MKKHLFFICLFVLLTNCFYNAYAACIHKAQIYNDGTGDNRTKKKGGNYTSLKLSDLKNNQTIRIDRQSGAYQYVTLHARYKGGYWKSIYQGPETHFPVRQYLAKYKKEKKCTHVNISVNGAHEKYEPIACKVNVLVCDKKDKRKDKVRPHKRCKTIAKIMNDGTGNNRTKKKGGNYASIKLSTLTPNQVIKIKKRTGTLNYVTLHARYKGGFWKTIYQGPYTNFPVSQYLTKYIKDKSCTHVTVSVNGAHEKYEPVFCKAEVMVCDPKKSKHDDMLDDPVDQKTPCELRAEIYNDGTGNNMTKKKGGNYTSLRLKSLSDDQVIKIEKKSGRLKYVTLHARYKGGFWKTIYKGPKLYFPVKRYLASYKKDSSCTHVNISVNGAHETYEPIACKANVLVCSKSEKPDVPDNSNKTDQNCESKAQVFNDGTGNNRTKKKGGNYTSIKLSTLSKSQVLKVEKLSGRIKYVTLHARYKGGYWKTIYQGPETRFPVKQYLKQYIKDKSCTHVNISVNGAHEKYEPIACKAWVLVCDTMKAPEPGGYKMKCDHKAIVSTDGTGDRRTKKKGGNYASLSLNSLKPNQTVKVDVFNGKLKYVTLHARYQGGYWKTIYQGKLKKFDVKEYFMKYKKDKKCTHINISVNGAHEKYDPVACKANIVVCSKFHR